VFTSRRATASGSDFAIGPHLHLESSATSGGVIYLWVVVALGFALIGAAAFSTFRSSQHDVGATAVLIGLTPMAGPLRQIDQRPSQYR